MNPPMLAERAALSDRIAAALNAPDTTAATVEALMAEVQPAAAALRARAEAARADALDPRRGAADVLALRDAADEATFEADRIDRAAEVLAVELERLRNVEAEAARVAAYDAAEAAAAATAMRIVRDYPALARGLLELLGEVAATTRAVVEANRNLPAGRQTIRGPEDRARGVNLTSGRSPQKRPWLLTEAFLPPLAPGNLALWPRDASGAGRPQDDALKVFQPFGPWPDRDHAARALADLSAQVEAVASPAS